MSRIQTGGLSMSRRLVSILFCVATVCLLAGRADAQDYMLTVDPTEIEIVAGEEGQIAVGLVGSGGFASVASVSLPPVTDVTFSPNTFAMVGGQITFVIIGVAPTATPRTEMVTIQGSSFGLPDRDVTFQLTIVNAPNFELITSAPTIEIAPGGSSQMTLTGVPVGVFSGNVSVQAFTGDPAVTVNPQMFNMGVPGPGQTVTISAGSGLTPGTDIPVVFFASGGGPVRQAQIDVIIVDPPDFQLMAAPAAIEISPGSTGRVTISGLPLNGFNGVVSVSSTSADPGVTVNPGVFNLPVPGSGQVVTLSVALGAMSGTMIDVTFSGTSGGGPPRTTIVQVTVGPPVDFVLDASPSMASAPAGTRVQIQVSATPVHSFAGIVSVTSTASSGVSVTPTSFNLTVPGAPMSVDVQIGTQVPLGPIQVTFEGIAPGIPTRQALVMIDVTAAPDFNLTVAPPFFDVTAGDNDGSDLTIDVQPVNGFNGVVSVTAPMVPGLTFDPANFDLTFTGLSASAQRTVRVLANRDAQPGSREIVFSATAPGVSGTRTSVPITANILEAEFGPLPVIDRITQESIVQGARSVSLLAEGRNFASGAMALSTEPGIRIDQTVVLDSNRAELLVSAANDVAPGGYPIGMRNPDGGESVQNGVLMVYPPDSLAAPLGVTAVVIVYPVEGSILGSGQEIHPRGLLAATGTGTITGAWRIDGIAFDQFIADVAGGEPISVESSVPIPELPWGEHSLELVIENPAVAEPAVLRVIASRTSAAGITLFAPKDNSIVGPAQRFRWSLVPGASAYEIEFAEVDEEGRPIDDRLRFSRADAEWTPTDGERTAVGTGIRLWRVRAILPGGGSSPPTEWQTVVFAADSVTLIPKDPDNPAVAAWAGEKPGLLYRFSIVDIASRSEVLEAWSYFPEYRVPFEAAILNLPAAVEVSAVAVTPWGEEVGRSGPITIERPTFVQVSTRASPSIDGLPETRFSTLRPILTAAWTNPVPVSDVRFLLDGADMTGMTRIDEEWLQFRPVIPLSSGVHRVAVLVGASAAQSSFEVVNESPDEASGADASYLFNPMVMVDWKEGTDPTGRIQISTKADVIGDGRETKWTGDLSFRGQYDPSSLQQESRNWLGQSSNPGADFRANVTVGLTVPAFTSSAEFLAPGVARTSVTAKASNALGSLSYYRPVDNELHGVVSSREKDVALWGFALESKEGRNSWARLIALVVEEKPSFYDAGSRTETFGLLGTWVVSPSLTIAYEAARGEVEDRGEVRSGEAFRLGLTGRRSALRYGLVLRHTDPHFVNPANRGFTPGGYSDRTSADLNLSHSAKGRSLNVTVRLIETGGSSKSTAPKTDHASAMISYSTPFGSPKQKLVLKGNVGRDEGEGDPSRFLPETDRTKAGLDATLEQTVGTMRISQTIGYQSTKDETRPTASQDVSSLKLTANGKMSDLVTVSALGSFVRTDGASSGTTDNLTVSLQPKIGHLGSSFSMSPVLQYRKSENDSRSSTNETTQIQTIFLWAPQESILSVQLAAHWTKTERESLTSRSSTDDRGVQLAVTIRWKRAAGM